MDNARIMLPHYRLTRLATGPTQHGSGPEIELEYCNSRVEVCSGVLAGVVTTHAVQNQVSVILCKSRINSGGAP